MTHMFGRTHNAYPLSRSHAVKIHLQSHRLVRRAFRLGSASEDNPDSNILLDPNQVDDLLLYSDYVFTTLFACEMLSKWVAMGIAGTHAC